MVQSTMPRDRVPIHLVLNFCEAGLHCVERLKVRADGEWSDVDMVYRKCVSLLHCTPHSCRKMSGIGHMGPLQPQHLDQRTW